MASDMTADQLRECPFCGKRLCVHDGRRNPYAHCATTNCLGGKLPVVNLDSPTDIAAWNTRPTAVASHAEVDTGNLVSDPLYLAMDALYERGWNDGEKHKHDPRGTNEWQRVLDLFRQYTHPPRSGDEALKVPDGYLLVRDPIHWGQEENKAWHRAIPSVRNAFIALANVTPKPAAMAARGGEKAA